MLDGEVLELVWRNGQVVIQCKNKKSAVESSLMAEQITNGDNRGLNRDVDSQVFMQDSEIISLLDYPLVVDSSLENTFRDEILYPALLRSAEQNAGDSSLGRARHGVEVRQPIPPMRRTEPEPVPEPVPVPAPNGLGVFSKHTGRFEPGSSKSKSVVRESPVFGPGGTPWLNVGDASSGSSGCRIMSGGGLAATSSDYVGRLMNTTNGGLEPAFQRMVNRDERMRKGKERVESDNHHRSTDFEFQPTDAKKQGPGSIPMKRSRAGGGHNLSERRRRDRINDRMRALKELIPDCTKTDKASMLSEAIEYLKSLELKLQIMSEGGGTVPTMPTVPTVIPSVQQVMPPMGMGFGMGTGMGMGFGMGTGMGMETSANRPMMPYPNMLAGLTFPRPAGAAQLGQPFTYPAFHMVPVPMVHVPNTEPSRFQGTNQLDHMYNSSGMQNIYQPRVPTSLDAYQQFLASQQMPVPAVVPQPFAQNQPVAPIRSHNQHTSWGLDSIDTNEPESPTMDY